VANEYFIRAIANALEVWSRDCETLGDFLNLRSRDQRARFKPAAYSTPGPGRYPTPRQSVARAADLLALIADNNAATTAFLGAQATAPEPLKRTVSDDQLFQLIAHWQTAIAGVFTTILRLYGLRPSELEPVVHPGPAPEARLWCEVVCRLEKIAQDTIAFGAAQRIPAKPKPASNPRGRPLHESLLRIERDFHRLAQDLMQIASVLPYHLQRARG
jgi:hypothetical protein